MTARSTLLRAFVATMAIMALVAAPAYGATTDIARATVDAQGLTAQDSSATKLAKATITKKKLKKQYKRILKQALAGKGVFNAQYSRISAYDLKYWKQYLTYSVYDIDRNGTKELLVRAGVFSNDMSWHVFTVSGKKLQYLGTFASGVLMAGGKAGNLYVWNSQAFYRWMNLVAVLYGNIRQQGVVSDAQEQQGFPLFSEYVSKHNLKNVKTSSATKYALLNYAMK